jgi:hypothetical protein
VGRGHDRLDPHRSRHLRSAPRALRATVTTRRARRDHDCRRAARRRKTPIGIFSSVEVLPESAWRRAGPAVELFVAASHRHRLRWRQAFVCRALKSRMFCTEAQICMRIEGVASGYPLGISAATWMRSVRRGPRLQVTPHTGDADAAAGPRSCSLSGTRTAAGTWVREADRPAAQRRATGRSRRRSRSTNRTTRASPLRGGLAAAFLRRGMRARSSGSWSDCRPPPATRALFVAASHPLPALLLERLAHRGG